MGAIFQFQLCGLVKSESQENGEFFGGPKSTYRVGLMVEFEIAALIPTRQVIFN